MSDKTVVDYALRSLPEFGLTATLDEDRPDVKERNAPAVDFSASSNVGVLAIEHSLHEPYEGYSADMNTMAARLDTARRTIERVIPPNASITIGMKHATVNRLRAHHFPEFTEWGLAVVPTLWDSPERHYEVWRHADGVEITIYRRRRSDGLPLSMLSIGWDTNDAKPMIERTTRGLMAKLPKLEASRTVLGAAATILVLESDDFQMTSPFEVGTSIRDIVDGKQLPPPDFIILVHSYSDGTPTFASIFRASGEWSIGSEYLHRAVPPA